MAVEKVKILFTHPSYYQGQYVPSGTVLEVGSDEAHNFYASNKAVLAPEDVAETAPKSARGRRRKAESSEPSYEDVDSAEISADEAALEAQDNGTAI